MKKFKRLNRKEIDGNRLNNHPSNLKLMSRSEHSKLHCEQGDFAIGVKNFNS